VGLVFAVFASLLLFNFVSVSISNKRKEIGILRAVGARGVDVFKIFFAESGIIVGICTLLSLVGTVTVCAVLNTVLRTQIGISISLFVFGIVSVVMMIAIALVVAFVATFLPVFFAARKKPVDSIRAL
ncbi:MAG: FtsX-like permease family protein, partial [Clostridia bacterium]|nr:FtsX-like permease family protein [Clostridia bacterium]